MKPTIPFASFLETLALPLTQDPRYSKLNSEEGRESIHGWDYC